MAIAPYDTAASERSQTVENDHQRAAALALVAQDHRRLAASCEALSYAIESGRDRAIVRECIVGLIVCARDHFANEEWAMRAVDAPDYLSHKAEHIRLLRDASDMLENFDVAFTPADWTAVAAFYRHWLRAHHRRYDTALFARLRDRSEITVPAA